MKILHGTSQPEPLCPVPATSYLPRVRGCPTAPHPHPLLVIQQQAVWSSSLLPPPAVAWVNPHVKELHQHEELDFQDALRQQMYRSRIQTWGQPHLWSHEYAVIQSPTWGISSFLSSPSAASGFSSAAPSSGFSLSWPSAGVCSSPSASSSFFSPSSVTSAGAFSSPPSSPPSALASSSPSSVASAGFSAKII